MGLGLSSLQLPPLFLTSRMDLCRALRRTKVIVLLLVLTDILSRSEETLQTSKQQQDATFTRQEGSSTVGVSSPVTAITRVTVITEREERWC